MEVTTVSPSPASSTEGHDLCEIDVSNVAVHSVTLLISFCGLAGNGAVLCLLSLKSPNSGIFDLAFTDFLFLLFMVPSVLLFLVEDVSCTPILPLMYVSFLFHLSVVSYFWGLFRLTGRRNMTSMYKLCACRFSLRLSWVLGSLRFWSFFALFTVIPVLTSLCPSQQQEQCRAVIISMCIVILLLFAVPMVISSTMAIITAWRGPKKQQHKKRSIVISLIVVFTLLLSLYNFLQQLGYIPVSTQVVFLLNCIHSSIKPFIYFVAGRCWSPCSVKSLQLSLQKVFEEKDEKTALRNDATRNTGV